MTQHEVSALNVLYQTYEAIEVTREMINDAQVSLAQARDNCTRVMMGHEAVRQNLEALTARGTR